MRKFLFFLPLILAGCSSGGSDVGTPLQVEQHAPQIGKLILLPDMAIYMEGDGSISATASFNYTDNGRDISEMHVEISDGTRLTLSLSGVDATVAGTHVAEFDLPTATIGPHAVEIWVVDAAGDSSNRLTAKFDIIDMPLTSEWTNRLQVPYPMTDVAWDGQVFVAVGYGNAILTSADGIDWVARDSTTEADLLAVTTDGTNTFAVGGEIVLLSTDHGETWIAKAGPEGFALTAVAVNAPQVVVMGAGPLFSSILMISEDHGDTWQTSYLSWAATDMIYRDGLFVALTYSSVMVSTDGKSWNQVVLSETSVLLRAVLHDGSQFIVAGDGGTVFSSFDGFNWTRLSTPFEDVDYQSAAWNGSRLVLAGGFSYDYRRDGKWRPTGISSSDGGASWDIFDIDSGYQSNGIAWGNGRFVSVGWTPESDRGAVYTGE